MKVASGRVVSGKVVTRTRLREGERVVIVREDDRPPIKLSKDDEEAVRKGAAQVAAGHSVAGSVVRARIRKYLR